MNHLHHKCPSVPSSITMTLSSFFEDCGLSKKAHFLLFLLQTLWLQHYDWYFANKKKTKGGFCMALFVFLIVWRFFDQDDWFHRWLNTKYCELALEKFIEPFRIVFFFHNVLQNIAVTSNFKMNYTFVGLYTMTGSQLRSNNWTLILIFLCFCSNPKIFQMQSKQDAQHLTLNKYKVYIILSYLTAVVV